MANWLLSASEKWLRPVYDTLYEQLRREPVLHAAMDERYCSQLFKLEQALAELAETGETCFRRVVVMSK